MGNLGYSLQVGHFQLRVRHYLQKDAGRLLVNGCLHCFQTGEVAQAGFHTEALQRAGNERQCVAKKVARGDNILTLHRYSQQRITDGGHA